MPVKIRRLPKSKKFRVTHNGIVSSKGTTKTKAEKQAILLRGIAHGMVPRKSKKK